MIVVTGEKSEKSESLAEKPSHPIPSHAGPIMQSLLYTSDKQCCIFQQGSVMPRHMPERSKQMDLDNV